MCWRLFDIFIRTNRKNQYISSTHILTSTFQSDFLVHNFDTHRKYLKRHNIDSFYHISFMTTNLHEHFSPEDPPKYKPFMRKNMTITHFSKSKIDRLVQDLKKSYKIDRNLPLNFFFYILKIILLLLCFQTRSLSEISKELRFFKYLCWYCRSYI